MQKNKKMKRKTTVTASAKKDEGSISSRDASVEAEVDATATLMKEEIENGINKDELQEKFDGWEFYKKKKTATTMVRRYCATLDQDYMKNKIMVVAYINHIFDLYLNQRRPFMTNQ